MDSTHHGFFLDFVFYPIVPYKRPCCDYPSLVVKFSNQKNSSLAFFPPPDYLASSESFTFSCEFSDQLVTSAKKSTRILIVIALNMHRTWGRSCHPNSIKPFHSGMWKAFHLFRSTLTSWFFHHFQCLSVALLLYFIPTFCSLGGVLNKSCFQNFFYSYPIEIQLLSVWWAYVLIPSKADLSILVR